jgi:DNA-directed RNA polymerase beta' subunit
MILHLVQLSGQICAYDILIIILSILGLVFNSCTTCRLTYFTCPGHFGHIELPAPVFHPLFMANMYNLLRATCLFCHRFKLSRTVVCTLEPQMFLPLELFHSYASTWLNANYWSAVSWTRLKAWTIYIFTSPERERALDGKRRRATKATKETTQLRKNRKERFGMKLCKSL